MAALLLLSPTATDATEVLPALGLLGHTVTVRPPDVSALLDSPAVDVVVVDARSRLVEARALCRLVRATGLTGPLLAVVTEAGWAAVSGDWGVDDVLPAEAGPGELEGRLRLATGRGGAPGAADTGAAGGAIQRGGLVIDETTYSCRLHARQLDLTFKEFELLKHLAQHPGRVFTRAQLLQEVWGYDYYGGTRTVDVHVRRLRAKLGTEHEALIGTVRNVGYKFVTAVTSAAPPAVPAAAGVLTPG
jgi:DNA-binding response OmpR family regulator